MSTVGISLLTLVPGKLGGSESATSGLLNALARTGTLDYRVYLPPVAPDAHEGLPHEIVRDYRPAQTIPERLLAMVLAAAHQGPLRRDLADAAVVHYPLTIRLPTVASPSVVTLHDLQHLDLPGFFPRSERAFRRIAWHGSVRGANVVVCPSAFVRDRAVTLLGIDELKIRVIPHGLDHARFSPEPGERDSFLLYPARTWPHKNHELLFQAFALLRRERPELRLVLTGGGDAREAPEGVEIRGHVSIEELVELYRTAAALVFPSRYEGFGQPVLEAMACGCPVACSAIAPLLELTGDAAVTFDPDDPTAIATAVRALLDAPGEYRERGIVRAAAFSWEHTAGDYEAVYRELL
jgi:glycosyltransferase involved in cell wall biosynthesis